MTIKNNRAALRELAEKAKAKTTDYYHDVKVFDVHELNEFIGKADGAEGGK